MCGIIGAIGQNINQEVALKIFMEIEARGSDASGFFIPTVGVVKNNKKISELIKEHEETFRENLEVSNLFIGHTRLATHGDPINNENNHPIESKNWWLVHNGQVRLKDIEEYQYRTETDSENILAYIEHFGLEEGLKHVNSSAAIILVPKQEENTLYFMKTKDASMCLSYLPRTDTLYISSGESYSKKGYFETKPTFISRLGGLIIDSLDMFQVMTPTDKSLYKVTLKNENIHITSKQINMLYHQKGKPFVEKSTRAVPYTKWTNNWNNRWNSPYNRSMIGDVKSLPYEDLPFERGDVVVLTRNNDAFLLNAVWQIFYKPDNTNDTEFVKPKQNEYALNTLKKGDLFIIERQSTMGYKTHITMTRYIAKHTKTGCLFNIPHEYLDDAPYPDCFCLLYPEDSKENCEECAFFSLCRETVGVREKHKTEFCKEEFNENSGMCDVCPYVFYCLEQTSTPRVHNGIEERE